MTEIYLHFRCTHYGLYGNAPVMLWLPPIATIPQAAAASGLPPRVAQEHLPDRHARADHTPCGAISALNASPHARARDSPGEYECNKQCVTREGGHPFPNVQTCACPLCPTSSIATVCSAPHATSRTAMCGSSPLRSPVVTRVGRQRLASSPWPSRPDPPCPHVQRCPSSVIAAVW